jgi:GTP cyclohydrolase-4
MHTTHTVRSEEHTVYLALGSNVGDRYANLATTIARLRTVVALQCISSIYETEPVGYLDQARFLNMVCGGQTQLTAQDLLKYVKTLEVHLGRQPTFRNGPRSIDIDILLYDNLQITQENLIIPHPRMTERAFILTPLAQIAPDVLHPANGKTIHELLAEIPQQGIRKFPLSI